MVKTKSHMLKTKTHILVFHQLKTQHACFLDLKQQPNKVYSTTTSIKTFPYTNVSAFSVRLYNFYKKIQKKKKQ